MIYSPTEQLIKFSEMKRRMNNYIESITHELLLLYRSIDNGEQRERVTVCVCACNNNNIFFSSVSVCVSIAFE